jgi:hypothetical protein
LNGQLCPKLINNKEKYMSNKIFEVTGSAQREVRESSYGSFHSSQNPDDIEKWLKHSGADESSSDFEDVFGDNWEHEYGGEEIEDYSVEFNEVEDSDSVFYEFEESIQEFLDEEPQRLRDEVIRKVTYQLNDLMGNIDGIKDTTVQLLNDFKDVIKTDDVESLPEEEKKLYKTLNDITQLTLKFPKSKVEEETYEPF